MTKESTVVTYSAKEIDCLSTKTNVKQLKLLGDRHIDFSDIPAIDMRYVKLVEKHGT